jgi:Spy/CpxP family protein refolding chaperone
MVGAFLVAAAGLYAADEQTKVNSSPSTKPAARGGGRLVKPWSDLKDLTADQTDKIREIHKKCAAEMAEIRAKENEECLAVLSDEQKKELVDVKIKTAAERKLKGTTIPAASSQ